MEGEEKAVKVEAQIAFRFPGREAAEAAYKSLSGEGNVGGRSRSEASLDGDTVRITIRADDAVSFRATMNGFLRAVQVFEGAEALDIE